MTEDKSAVLQRQYSPEFLRVKSLVDFLSHTMEPKMKWMWGEALLGWSMTLLDEEMCSEDYTSFLSAYCDYYVKNPPRVDYADTAAPALITYAMQKKTGNSAYQHLTDRVLEYIRYEPRVLGDAVNHLGKSPEGKFYPKSIWVDSLMMFSVFPALYAKENGDAKLLSFAARQPRIYAGYMQDEKAHLWYHSYWVKAGRPHPGHNVFWGRGNGWVMASLPMILEQIGPNHLEAARIIELLQQTAAALLPYQNEDGTFNTVIGRHCYRELSATALIAAGLLHGSRCGWLQDQKYHWAGEKAFRAVAGSITRTPDGEWYLPEISAPTIPLPIFPYTCYKLTPKGRNWSYGVAAAVFAALEYERGREQGGS